MTKNTSLDKEMASILIPQIAYIDVWDQLSASFEYSYVTRISQISKQKHSKFLNSKNWNLSRPQSIGGGCLHILIEWLVYIPTHFSSK